MSSVPSWQFDKMLNQSRSFASYHLHKQGCIILHIDPPLPDNYGIDIVALKDDVLHFVMVKSVFLDNPDFVLFPESRYSESRVRRSVEAYSLIYSGSSMRKVVDFIGVVFRKNGDSEHYLQQHDNVFPLD